MERTQKTMDGNQAAAHVAYAYSDAAAIYPITPSSTMAEYIDEWAAEGRENIFGQTVQIAEMQSEAGAAGAVHGSLAAGALTTTFTASQGLLLMIPNLYKIAGELLPGVFHVAARTVATHALSIFGDHSDIYACRQTGAAILASGSVQQVMDLAPVAHLSAIKGRLPFLHFFDGFRTSHEMQKIDIWSYEDLKDMADPNAISRFRAEALNPNHARLMGSAQNPDIFFQAREACNEYYNTLPSLVASYMDKVNEKAGTSYGLFNYYGAEDAEHIIVAMGSVCETIRETIDYLTAHTRDTGIKPGLVEVHLYRPFSPSHLLSCLPASTARITVLDRTKEPGAAGEPLYLDVLSALKDSPFAQIPVLSGRYGLSSKDTDPDQIYAVYQNSLEPGKKAFTLGITDDVTRLSLDITRSIDTTPQDTVCCKFWGLGGDGTISANKNSAKIIGNHTGKYVQAYFDYDSKKSRGLTVSHLRFGGTPIRSAYLIHRADFAACHNPAYLHKYNMVQEVKDGGIFLLNCYYKEEELEEYIPGQVKRYIAEHNIRLYIIDAIRIGKEIGLNNKISTILQAAFFRLTGIIPLEEARKRMKEAAAVSYREKGEKIIRMNYAAIDRGMEDVVEVSIPAEWKDAVYEPLDAKLLPDRPEVIDYVKNLQKPISLQQGNELPVSAFLPYVNGAFPSGSSAHERRSVATEVPAWKPENCIQCCRCSFVCPHAVIRPVAMSESEQKNAPEDMLALPMAGMPEYTFSITVSDVDCTGCGSCAGVCPGKKGEKALEMIPVKEHREQQQYFDYGKTLPPKKEIAEKFNASTVKGSQFKPPMLEFHGACAGCGETPYATLVTRLFGERMYIANATGCSSIWANSSPSTAYTANARGRGPAWSNSLFEDAAEFGFGMILAQNAIRKRLKDSAESLLLQLEPDSGTGTSPDKNPERTADGQEQTIKLKRTANKQKQAAKQEQEEKQTEKQTKETIEQNLNWLNNTRLSLAYALKQWLLTFSNSRRNVPVSDALIHALSAYLSSLERQSSCLSIKAAPPETIKLCYDLLDSKNFLSKKSQWIFGGDGWAYDIGFGGLDHVLASGADINVLVFDTEVYSNTGGQVSKATPMGSTAKFTSGGKTRKKKELAAMMMTYGYIYVAQIAMGADYNQTLQAITEAEAYPGPSLIIAYAPCISHGIRAGMGSSQHEEAKAVKAGYWHLFRFNPALMEQGENPFILDSKQPSMDYAEFLSGENRYRVLKKTHPETAGHLFSQAAQQAAERYDYFHKLVDLYGTHLL